MYLQRSMRKVMPQHFEDNSTIERSTNGKHSICKSWEWVELSHPDPATKNADLKNQLPNNRDFSLKNCHECVLPGSVLTCPDSRKMLHPKKANLASGQQCHLGSWNKKGREQWRPWSSMHNWKHIPLPAWAQATWLGLANEMRGKSLKLPVCGLPKLLLT